MSEDGQKLIVIGSMPPPLHGTAFMTPHMLRAVRAAGRFAAHLDTSDPRPVLTTGRFDLVNLWLGVRHVAELAWLLVRHRGAAVYLPISQSTWGFLRDAVFIWVSRLFRRAVIVHLNGGYFDEFWRNSSPPMRRLIHGTMAQVHEAWVLTPAHIRIFDGLVPRSRVSMLENTVDDLGVVGDPPGEAVRCRLLYLSNLLPEKGCFDLAEALERLGPAASGIEVRFAGEADEEALTELRARVTQLARFGITVTYDGPVTGRRKTEAFEWAEVFALPSRYPFEGQPLSLLEAMSAGLAVVSTDHSGIPHTARDGREALIVPPGDVDALAGAIRRLIDDPALRRRLGAAGRRRYVEAYTPDGFDAAVARLLNGRMSACGPTAAPSRVTSSDAHRNGGDHKLQVRP